MPLIGTPSMEWCSKRSFPYKGNSGLLSNSQRILRLIPYTMQKRPSSDGCGFHSTKNRGLHHRYIVTGNRNRWWHVIYSTFRWRPDIIPFVSDSCLIWRAALGNDIPVARKQWVGTSIMILIWREKVMMLTRSMHRWHVCITCGRQL
jgi:hypothetical protein